MITKNYDIVSAHKANVKDLNDIQKDDVVISITLSVSSKEEDKQAVLYVGVDLDVNDLSGNFIPIEDLNKEQLIKWALLNIDEEKLKRIDRILRNKLDHYKEPVKTPIVSDKKIVNFNKEDE